MGLLPGHLFYMQRVPGSGYRHSVKGVCAVIRLPHSFTMPPLFVYPDTMFRNPMV